jgi:hypothetical protein
MECIDIVNELNQRMWDLYQDSLNQFSYETNGYVDIIKFNESVIYNSECNDRKYIEKIDDYEPLLDYVIREYNIYIETISKYKL